jgi:hypothetical protein
MYCWRSLTDRLLVLYALYMTTCITKGTCEGAAYQYNSIGANMAQRYC